MILRQVTIDGFRSIKRKLPLLVDQSVTILIGANDHGKTNLLEAIRCLNEDRKFTAADENWDSVGKGKPVIEYHFDLDEEEKTYLLTKALDVAFVDEEEEGEEGEKQEPKRPNPISGESTDESETAVEEGAKITLPSKITFVRSGIGKDLTIQYPDKLATEATVVQYLSERRPRVELFETIDQLMDVVSLAQLEDPKQEFMQGIFRYAGIWDERKTLFSQNPATARRLEKASEDFTRRIRDEWKQGDNLTFRFQHCGQNGNQVELMIRDPAVN